MKSTPYSDLLANLKEQAMAIANSDQVSYMRSLNYLVQQHNFKSLGQLQNLVKSEAITQAIGDAEVLSCAPGLQTIYKVRIGRSVWSLRISKHGPKLCLEDRPICDFDEDMNTSDLGLFQVFVKASEMHDGLRGSPNEGWVLTRYGQYRVHTLEFFSDDDAKALSYQFGIPFANKSFGRYSQSQYSEICFLSSPAFAALRKAFRSGQAPLPPMKSWSYGLCSLWPHLVAMSDRDFAEVDRIIAWCFEAVRWNLPHDSLLERWDEVPTLGNSGKGITKLGAMFRKHQAVRKASHASRVRKSS